MALDGGNPEPETSQTDPRSRWEPAGRAPPPGTPEPPQPARLSRVRDPCSGRMPAGHQPKTWKLNARLFLEGNTS